MWTRITQSTKTRQTIFSLLIVLFLAATCFVFSAQLGYRGVAFILLLYVSVAAVMLDILPVLLSAIASAILWNYLFIPPRFTFHIGTREDAFLFLMYFIIALINAVLTYRIRLVQKQVLDKEQKEKTVQLYDTLLNSLSHELRTPIATVIGATDNLLENGEMFNEELKKELLENISAAGLRLNQQVENLLNMSRLQSGFVSPNKDWCDVEELVYTVLKNLDNALKHHDVLVEVEAGLPYYKIDFGLIEQALFNILYNAAIYTPGYTKITIRVRNINDRTYKWDSNTSKWSKLNKDSNALQIAIEDNGPGFPPGEIERVFDKFYRLPGTKPGGTGLGLSIVKGLVEACDGIVTLENIPHGARFEITIPAETSFINNLKND